jgi:hypothetical protein
MGSKMYIAARKGLGLSSVPLIPERSTVKLVKEPEIKETKAKSPLTALGLFFFVVVIALAVSIILHYL